MIFVWWRQWAPTSLGYSISSSILGKKLLTDTSFVSNLMKRTLEGPKDEIVAALRPTVADPNFEPSVVAKSSTAAKSTSSLQAMQQLTSRMTYWTHCSVMGFWLSMIINPKQTTPCSIKCTQIGAAKLRLKWQELPVRKAGWSARWLPDCLCCVWLSTR